MLQKIKPETAKLLKKKGFKYPCKMLYNDKGELSGTKMGMHGKPNDYEGYYAAYLLDEVIKILRDDYDIDVFIIPVVSINNGKKLKHYKAWIPDGNTGTKCIMKIYFNYEEAQEAGIIKTIELI
jgi:hypothetical protein